MNARSLAFRHLLITCLSILALLAGVTTTTPVFASDTPNPASVTIAGSLQSEIGCGGDWDPACAATHLTFDAGDDVWQGPFTVPGGNWEYKAALNDGWAESYGRNGANIALNLAANTVVKFYYDHKSHWVTDNQSSVIATAAGNFQAALGCPGDWQPDCLRSWLQDPDGNGIYTFETTALPAGNYEGKVALNES
jgi:pullulanase